MDQVDGNPVAVIGHYIVCATTGSRRRETFGNSRRMTRKRSVRFSGATRAQSSQSVSGARATPPWPKTSPVSSSSRRGADATWWSSNNARRCHGCSAWRTTRRATPLARFAATRQALKRLDGHRSLPDDDAVIDRLDAEISLNMVNEVARELNGTGARDRSPGVLERSQLRSRGRGAWRSRRNRSLSSLANSTQVTTTTRPIDRVTKETS